MLSNGWKVAILGKAFATMSRLDHAYNNNNAFIFHTVDKLQLLQQAATQDSTVAYNWTQKNQL